MLPSHIELEYFLEVSRTRNVSRAAERLGITQPSLSLALQRLERSVGTPLLLRSKTGVQLSKAGEQLAQGARDLLQSWDHLKGQALSSAVEVGGRYSLGCHTAVARYSLPRVLPDLLQKHPRLDFRLEHDISRRITEQVISRQLDFGLAVNPVAHPDLVIGELCRDRVTLWKAARGAVGDVLLADGNLAQSEFVLQKLASKGQRFARHMSSSSLELLADLCAAGVGHAVLPARVAALSRKPLRAVSGAPVFEDRICLIYRADAQRSPAARAIIAAIKAAKI